MSLFGSLMGNLEDDPIFGMHMRQMRQMNNMMNSLFQFPDPFGMMGAHQAALEGPQNFQRQLMPMFSNGGMVNRLLNGVEMPQGGVGYSSSSVFSMTTGPDGKPQIYKATSSTKAGPNGVKETRKTLEDSRTNTKKMSIGHHIYDKAHIITKQQDVSTGQLEEEEELINLDEEEKYEFDREFTQKTKRLMGQRAGPEIQALPSTESATNATTAATTSAYEKQKYRQKNSPSTLVVSPNRSHASRLGATPRRAIDRLSTNPTSPNNVTTSVHPHPYNPSSRKHRAIKGSKHHH